MRVTLQQMRLFEAVARHRSFTRVAEELCLTQPAVSIQIKRLEENAGLPLFEQLGRRILLTAAGREMHAACRHVLARLSVTNRERVILRLSENQDDLVIMGQVPDQLGVEAHPFLENVLVVVAHPEHPLVGERDISLERVCRERFLVRESGSGTRGAVDRLFAGRDLKVEPYMELGSSEAIKQAVMAAWACPSCHCTACAWSWPARTWRCWMWRVFRCAGGGTRCTPGPRGCPWWRAPFLGIYSRRPKGSCAPVAA
jgi:DNA-binding transcriptional LysR family regulator